MRILESEKEMARKIADHLNKNHIGEDGGRKKEWSANEVIGVALYEGLKNIMERHHLK